MSKQASTTEMLAHLVTNVQDLPEWEHDFILSINRQVTRTHGGDITKLSDKQVWRLGMSYQ